MEKINENIFSDPDSFVKEFKGYLIGRQLAVTEKYGSHKPYKGKIQNISTFGNKTGVLIETLMNNSVYILKVSNDEMQEFLDGEDVSDVNFDFALTLQEGLNEEFPVDGLWNSDVDMTPLMEAVENLRPSADFKYRIDGIKKEDWEKWMDKQKDNYEFKKSGDTIYVKNDDNHVMTYNPKSERLYADVKDVLGKKGESNESFLKKGDMAVPYLMDLWFAVHSRFSEKYADIAKKLDNEGISFKIQNEVSADAEASRKSGGYVASDVKNKVEEILRKNGKLNEASNKLSSFMGDIKDNNVVDTNLKSDKPKTLGGDDTPIDYIPQGYFTVDKDFVITPGGGWKMTFRRGMTIHSDGKGTVEVTNNETILKSFEGGNPFIFFKKLPPISGTKELKLTEYGRNPEQREMYNSFASSVKPISGKEMLDSIQKTIEKYGDLNEVYYNKEWNINNIKSWLRKYADEKKIKLDLVDSTTKNSNISKSKTNFIVYDFGTNLGIVIIDDRVEGAPRLNSIRVAVGEKGSQLGSLKAASVVDDANEKELIAALDRQTAKMSKNEAKSSPIEIAIEMLDSDKPQEEIIKVIEPIAKSMSKEFQEKFAEYKAQNITGGEFLEVLQQNVSESVDYSKRDRDTVDTKEEQSWMKAFEKYLKTDGREVYEAEPQDLSDFTKSEQIFKGKEKDIETYLHWRLFEGDMDESKSAPSLKEVNDMLAKKFPGLEVAKHHDTAAPSFYWYSDNDEILDYLSGLEDSTTVGVASTTHMTLDRWEEEAKEIMKDFKGKLNETKKIPGEVNLMDFKYNPSVDNNVSKDDYIKVKKEIEGKYPVHVHRAILYNQPDNKKFYHYTIATNKRFGEHGEVKYILSTTDFEQLKKFNPSDATTKAISEAFDMTHMADQMADSIIKLMDKSKQYNHKEFLDILTSKHALPHSSLTKEIKSKLREKGFNITESKLFLTNKK